MNKKITGRDRSSSQLISSSLEAWEGILQTPELVKYFRGIFNS